MRQQRDKFSERLNHYTEKGVLTPAVAAILAENPELLKTELQNRQKLFPSIGFVPNIAQERALACLREKHPVYGDYPFITMLTGGNGVGKTCDIAAILLPGMCLGPNFVNKQYCDYGYFREIEQLRKERAAMGQTELHLRLVCGSEDMSESGSLYKEIRLWNPKAEFLQKGNKSYGAVRIGNVTIDVKTFDQDVVTHAGPTLDAVIFNEPPPQEIWAENIGRLRKGGRCFAFLTPVGGAAFLFDILNGDFPEGEIVHYEAPIWENCADIPGTRGHLSRRDIERLIRQWQANNPDEVEARELGKFMNLTGAVFKNFDRKIHCVAPMRVDPKWIVMQTADPHRAKPPFAIWTAQTPGDDILVIAEYPNRRWDHIKTCELTIQQICMEWEQIEQARRGDYTYLGSPLNVVKRYGDPNMFVDMQPESRTTLQQIYAKYGFSFSLDVDDALAPGYDKIREFLTYDKARPLDSFNRPRIFVFDTCVNTRLALEQHGYKKRPGGMSLSDDLDPKWKCVIDCVRYRLMKFTPYDILKERLGVAGGSMAAVSSDSTGRRNAALAGVRRR